MVKLCPHSKWRQNCIGPRLGSWREMSFAALSCSGGGMYFPSGSQKKQFCRGRQETWIKAINHDYMGHMGTRGKLQSVCVLCNSLPWHKNGPVIFSSSRDTIDLVSAHESLCTAASFCAFMSFMLHNIYYLCCTVWDLKTANWFHISYTY